MIYRDINNKIIILNQYDFMTDEVFYLELYNLFYKKIV